MLYIPYPFKSCRNCNTEFLPSFKFFYRNRTSLDSLCKKCRNDKNKEYAESHPDIIARIKKDYLVNHPEERKQTIQRYRETHKKECAERIQAWKYKNWIKVLQYAHKSYWKIPPEERRRRRRKQKENHPERDAQQRKKYWSSERGRAVARSQQQKRRAKKQGLLAGFTANDWNRALEYFNWRCAYCGRVIGFWHILAEEHFVAASKGGTYTVDNIIPACHAKKGAPADEKCCNNDKSDKLAEEWLVERFGKRKAKLILQQIYDYFEWVKQFHSE